MLKEKISRCNLSGWLLSDEAPKEGDGLDWLRLAFLASPDRLCLCFGLLPRPPSTSAPSLSFSTLTPPFVFSFSFSFLFFYSLLQGMGLMFQGRVAVPISPASQSSTDPNQCPTSSASHLFVSFCNDKDDPVNTHFRHDHLVGSIECAGDGTYSLDWIVISTLE
jgi:hypothetical protein